MFKLASLFVQIDGKTAGFNAAIGAVHARLTATSAQMAAFTSRAGNLFALGATLAGGAFLIKAVKAASDLNETLSKVDVILGDASPAVKAFADDMAKKFGLVKRDTLDAAAAFGGLGKGLGGLAGKELSDFSIKFTKLSADLSSMANIDMKEASKAIQVGLSGEQSDTLKQLGVTLLDTKVQAEAAAMGFKKVNKEFTDAQKVAARASLIMKGLADASGDLERTADSTANQFRKAGGGVENFAASLGQVLLPIVNAGTTAFNELMASVLETFESNKAGIEEWAAYLTDGINTVSMIVRNWPDVWEIASLMIQEKIANVIDWIGVLPENLGIVAGYVSGNWKELILDAFNAVAAANANLATNFLNLGSAIVSFLQDPTKGFKFEWTPLLDGFEATAAALPEMVKPHLTSLQDEIDKASQRIVDRETARINSIKKAAAPAKPAGKNAQPQAKEKEETLGFAEFASKLRGRQNEERDKKLEDNTEALKVNGDAVKKLTEGIAKGATARFAS
jgi:hypothetical protein